MTTRTILSLCLVGAILLNITFLLFTTPEKKQKFRANKFSQTFVYIPFAIFVFHIFGFSRIFGF